MPQKEFLVLNTHFHWIANLHENSILSQDQISHYIRAYIDKRTDSPKNDTLVYIYEISIGNVKLDEQMRQSPTSDHLRVNF